MKIRLHPIILILYFGSMITFTMCTLHIFMLSISLFMGVIFLSFLVGVKKVVKSYLLPILPLFLLIVFVNGAFNHYGETSLYMMENGNSITLECILFGIVMGLMVMATLIWLASFNQIIKSDDVLYLTGKILPSISLVISMSLRFIPLYKKNYREIKKTSKILGQYNDEKKISRIKTTYHNYSILFSRCLEESVETASSMQNRGFGVKSRTLYHNYHFGIREIRQIIYLSIFILIVFIGYFKGLCYANYNPAVVIKNNVFVFVAYVILGFFPIVFYLAENRQFKEGK